MPAGGLVDIQVKIFDEYDSGEVERAIELQSRLFPLLFHASTHGAVFHKYLLWRRGILDSPSLRDPQAIYLDKDDEKTIEDRYARIRELLDYAGDLDPGRRLP